MAMPHKNPHDLSEKSDEQVVELGLKLARRYYEALGYQVEEGFKFYNSSHPQEQSMWNLAVIALEVLTDTDLNDALANIGE